MTLKLHASECPNCGGPISYAEREDDGAVVSLCRGRCGKWCVLKEVATNDRDAEDSSSGDD